MPLVLLLLSASAVVQVHVMSILLHMLLARLLAWEEAQPGCNDAEFSVCTVLIALFLPRAPGDFLSNKGKVAENAGGSGLSGNDKRDCPTHKKP
jgi:hypothetical protein